MRLDQFLSQSLNISRQQAKLLVRKNKLEVNQQRCLKAQQQVQQDDLISLDGKIIAWPGESYWMMHKAANTCCSHIDDGYPSALKSLPVTKKKLHFAGRLDADTTGLLLLSSDGQWCHRISSPKQSQQKQKIYEVGLSEPLNVSAVQQLQEGIMLHGENKVTLPAKLKMINERLCHLSINEGRYHQVKRMFAAVENKVISLHRLQISSLMLDANLAEGDFRHLTEEEIALF